MPRVKIKASNPNDPRRKNTLLETLAKEDIYITKLIPLTDGFVIITSSDHDLDKLFNSATTTELLKNDFHPLIPPELKANRCVIIPNVDNYIYTGMMKNQF